MVEPREESSIRGTSSMPEMDYIFSLANQVQRMLDFEAALVHALEDCSLAPAGSASVLAELQGETFLNSEREASIRQSARLTGNLAIPFVKLLTAAIAERSTKEAGYVHFGATSQDVLDSALALQMREGFEILQTSLGGLQAACLRLARDHAETVMAGRTWLQQGPPVTLGWKAAGWADALFRHRQRLTEVGRRAVRLQFGGAVGTLASLGQDGLRVSAALAQRLGLPEAEIAWHTHRDNLAEVAATLGILTGTLGKIARDISLLMQTEVGEVMEPGAPDRGGSSTMPHKRNPVGCAAVLAAATRVPGLVATMLSAMPQEHERGLGGWQAEWETLPEIFRLTGSALVAATEIVTGLEVHPEAMAANLAASGGLPMAEAVSSALAAALGREKAHALIEAASHRALAEKLPLREVLAGMPEVMEHLSLDEIDRLLLPENYLGSTAGFIQRVLDKSL
jgi:3-carboxy-cis,cis-muconate cycloisomerase